MEQLNIKIAKMNTLKLSTVVFLIGIWANAQTISVEDHGLNYVGKKSLVKAGITYVKDVNNVLDKYVGTWVGENDGKHISFVVKKVTYTTRFAKIKFDKLLIKHITKVNGVIVDNTVTLEDTDPLVIKGSYLAKSGNYVLNYISKDRDCAQHGSLYIYIDNNNTTLKCLLILDAEFIDPTVCDGVDVFKYIPETFELTKQ